MKSILLAAAAIIAMPAIAQEQPAGTAGQTMPDTTMQGTGTGTGTMGTGTMGTGTTGTGTMGSAGDPTTQTGTTGTTGGMNSSGTMGTTGGMNSSRTTGTTGGMAQGGGMSGSGDPAGGYQPSTPPMQGTPAPGATVRFQAAPDPNTAFPPPAPMQNYPVCKKGQYDKCIQRGGK